jgi:chitinase
MLKSQSSPATTSNQQPGEVAVTLTPALAHVAVGNGIDLTATLAGTDTPDVTWTVQESGAVGHVVPRGVLAKGGKLSATAVYVAGSSPGTYHVIVSSKADPSKSAVAEITVTETGGEPAQ